jgi:hypothetical protein
MPKDIETLEEDIEQCWKIAIGRYGEKYCNAECKADCMRFLGWLHELKRYKEKYGEL